MIVIIDVAMFFLRCFSNGPTHSRYHRVLHNDQGIVCGADWCGRRTGEGRACGFRVPARRIRYER